MQSTTPIPAPLNVPARLAQLRADCAQDGWLDGEGYALSAADLDSLATTWARSWPEAAALPHIYPTLDANLSFEWDSESVAVEAYIQLSTMKCSIGSMSGAALSVVSELSLDLTKEADWLALANFVTAVLD